MQEKPEDVKDIIVSVRLRIPRDMNPEQTRQELLTCISFGNPRVYLERDPRLTLAQIRDWSPACWFWPITPEISKLASSVRSHANAVKCLLEWMYACSVCGIMVGEMVADHCHQSRLLRGMLCHRCNILEPHHEGIFGRYRDRTAAARLGMTVRYIRP